ncbi:hypothetical protein [Actinokineospora sp.]|uniref:hypothetical protein n=1 Tax=Actinokineospora sp. TaxID=1872133 RepID=UPI004037B909
MRATLASVGMSAKQAEAILGMSTGLRDGFVPEQARDATSTTATTLAAWSYDVLRPSSAPKKANSSADKHQITAQTPSSSTDMALSCRRSAGLGAPLSTGSMVRIVVLAALASLAAGCSSTTEGTPVAASTSATKVTTTTAKTTATTPPPTAAADGTDLTACADGTCEVRIAGEAGIPVAPASGIAFFQVAEVTADAVSMAFVAGPGSFSFGCDGDARCESSVVGASAGSPAIAYATGHQGARFTANRLTAAVIAVGGGSAILRITTV